MTASAAMAARKTVSLLFRMARIAAMKKVLSPSSDTCKYEESIWYVYTLCMYQRLFVFNCESNCPCPLHSVLYFVSDISNKMSITLRSLFYQLYQLTSAVQLRLSKFISLSLSTPFHFRYHNLIKWLFCSALCFRYINSKQNVCYCPLIFISDNII